MKDRREFVEKYAAKWITMALDGAIQKASYCDMNSVVPYYTQAANAFYNEIKNLPELKHNQQLQEDASYYNAVAGDAP